MLKRSNIKFFMKREEPENADPIFHRSVFRAELSGLSEHALTDGQKAILMKDGIAEESLEIAVQAELEKDVMDQIYGEPKLVIQQSVAAIKMLDPDRGMNIHTNSMIKRLESLVERM